MSEDGKLIFLAFSNPKALTEEARDFLACNNCRNKTFTLIYDRGGSFPTLTCAACGSHLGTMGWASHDDPPPSNSKSRPKGSPPSRG